MENSSRKDQTRRDNQKDRWTVRQLLDKARVQSLNSMVIQDAGMLVWHAMNGGPLHMDYHALRPDTRTRAATDALLRIPPTSDRARHNGALIWNSCPELRAAKTISAAKKTLKAFASKAPI